MDHVVEVFCWGARHAQTLTDGWARLQMVFFVDTKLWVVAAVGHCRAADPVAQPARNGLPLPFHSGPLISVGRNNALVSSPLSAPSAGVVGTDEIVTTAGGEMIPPLLGTLR